MDSFHELAYMESSLQILNLGDEIRSLQRKRDDIQREIEQKLKKQGELRAKNERFLRIINITKGCDNYSPEKRGVLPPTPRKTSQALSQGPVHQPDALTPKTSALNPSAVKTTLQDLQTDKTTDKQTSSTSRNHKQEDIGAVETNDKQTPSGSRPQRQVRLKAVRTTARQAPSLSRDERRDMDTDKTTEKQTPSRPRTQLDFGVNEFEVGDEELWNLDYSKVLGDITKSVQRSKNDTVIDDALLDTDDDDGNDDDALTFNQAMDFLDNSEPETSGHVNGSVQTTGKKDGNKLKKKRKSTENTTNSDKATPKSRRVTVSCKEVNGNANELVTPRRRKAKEDKKKEKSEMDSLKRTLNMHK